jgi:hypothetical protein
MSEERKIDSDEQESAAPEEEGGSQTGEAGVQGFSTQDDIIINNG